MVEEPDRGWRQIGARVRPADHHHGADAAQRDAAPKQLEVLALQRVALVRGVDRVAVLLRDARGVGRLGRVAGAAVLRSEYRHAQHRRRDAGHAERKARPEERPASCR